MNVMDPALRERLAEWLAYHLSNFEYVWPWAKWAHVLEAPAYDGQRRFCVAVMNRLVRLSYWDRVQSVLPEDFRPLLPPKPEVAPLPPPDADGGDLEGGWAARALQLVRSKASPAELEAWLGNNALEAALGGGVGVLRMLARCLLVAGAKSYTHMSIALERYYGLLAKLAGEAGEAGEAAMVEVAAAVWAANPQRAAMAVDRLMGLRLVSARAVVAWAFRSDGVRSIADESRCGMAWDVLYAAVNKTSARVQDAGEELAAGRAHAEHTAAAAASGAGPQEAADAAAAALPEKEAYLAETTAQQRDAVLQVLHCFVEMLGEGGVAAGTAAGGEGDAMDADTDEHTALHDYTLASLKSFLRRYNLEMAQVAERVEAEILGAQGLAEDVKGAVQAHLYL
jgi:nuclear cap-binding protein subunit 1